MFQNNTNIISVKTKSVKRVALYVRVSTGEQRDHGISIDDQINTLTSFANANDYEIVSIYNDAGRTAHAKYTKRPELLRLLDDCKAGLIDTILFTRLDRWFRSLPEYYAVQSILDESNVSWSAILEDYNTETSQGQFVVNIMLSIAQAEAERTSEKVRSALEHKKAKGEYIGGKMPIGYKRTSDGGVIKDPDKEELMDRLFSTMLKTRSSYQAWKECKEIGNYQHVRRILTSPRYTGVYKGYPIPAYITQEQHEFILASIRQFHKKEGRVYLFSCLIRCGKCGMKYCGRYYDDHDVFRYVCASVSLGERNCHNPSCREDRVEQFLLDQIRPDLKDVKPAIKRTKPKKPDYTDLLGQLDRLKELYIIGDIAKDAYLKRKSDIESKMKPSEAQEPKRKPTALPKNWEAVYAELNREQKRDWWKSIVKEITVNGSEISVEFL